MNSLFEFQPPRFYNSRTKQVEPFVPKSSLVRMYSCGPTVYSTAHVGNLRAYVFADILKRFLRWRGHDVRHVINVTDVGHLVADADVGEDKVAEAAKRLNQTIHEVTHRFFDQFVVDIEQLSISQPDEWTWASDYVERMITFARELERKGYTYRLPSGLYFDTAKFPAYGDMATVDLENLREGARIGVTEGRKSPTDFALWRTFSDEDKRALSWESPWGRGAPGWHLECSVMSIESLGEHFDIHTGGVDHINVHHINEIAQSEAYLDDKRPWVPLWMHGEFLVLGGEKMAKSKGQVLTLSDLVEAGVSPESFRWYLLTASYRSTISFNLEVLQGVNRSVHRTAEWFCKQLQENAPSSSSLTLNVALDRASTSQSRSLLMEFDNALADDLATPRALAVLEKLKDLELPPSDLRVWNDVISSAVGVDFAYLGAQLLARREQEKSKIDQGHVEDLVSRREMARKGKNFALADSLRNELDAIGVTVEDTPEGPTWSIKDMTSSGPDRSNAAGPTFEIE